MTRRALLLCVPVLALACAPPRDPGSGGRDGGFAGPDGGVVTAAIAGARCPLTDRVGQIQVWSADGLVGAHATLFDRPAPWHGEPALQDESCAHHVGPSGGCFGCSLDEVCGFDGACVSRPRPAASLRLVLRAGAEEQELTGDAVSGSAGGDVTLTSTTLAVELHGSGQVITTAETSIPADLTGLSGTLEGDFDSPGALDFVWDAPVDGASVFTKIPINHHVGTETFTECTVDAAAGALHVEAEMIAPLAVVTGLEFQELSHVRFAAAETPIGCVEVQFVAVQPIDLEL